MTRERDRIQENANSYVVKNCPCIKHYDDIELDNRCMSDQGIPFFCENNPDCVIKQVIEKCMHEAHGAPWQIVRAGDVFLANDILKLFDIEEINK